MVEGDVRESAKDREAGQVQNSGSVLSPPREMSSNGRAGGMGRRRSQTQATADQGSFGQWRWPVQGLLFSFCCSWVVSLTAKS